MNNALTFQFHTHAVRTILKDGEPWFVAADVCKALEYRDAEKGTRILGTHQKGSATILTPGGNQPVTVINESGLYRLVLRSRKPEAVAFSDWVTGEVMPSIRKTGQYSHQSNHPSLLGRRWLLSYDHNGKEHVTPVPEGAFVATPPKLLEIMIEPNGIHIDTDLLARFTVACAEMLGRRCAYYEPLALKRA